MNRPDTLVTAAPRSRLEHCLTSAPASSVPGPGLRADPAHLLSLPKEEVKCQEAKDIAYLSHSGSGDWGTCLNPDGSPRVLAL